MFSRTTASFFIPSGCPVTCGSALPCLIVFLACPLFIHTRLFIHREIRPTAQRIYAEHLITKDIPVGIRSFDAHTVCTVCYALILPLISFFLSLLALSDLSEPMRNSRYICLTRTVRLIARCTTQRSTRVHTSHSHAVSCNLNVCLCLDFVCWLPCF